MLLDTHAYLWWLQDSPRLSPRARQVLGSDAPLYWSAASTWECAIKIALGRLRLPDRTTLRALSERLTEDAIHVLPIQQHHAVAVESLPRHHRDPFDRMLIAQARTERMTILTADATLSRYDVATDR